MDIQMPEMNGIEATKIIRNKLKIKTPIIALSANAFKSEVSKCLEIGMNDYITKPFDDNDLIGIIAKYCTAKKTITKDKSSNSAIASPLYDLSKLKNLSKGNVEFTKKMLSLFVNSFPQYITDLENFLQNKNISKINELAHKIKPSVNDMGILSIKENILDLERFKLEDSSDKQLSKLVLNVTSTLTKVVQDLNKEYF
jgi:CheY-like chemotaxis protein